MLCQVLFMSYIDKGLKKRYSKLNPLIATVWVQKFKCWTEMVAITCSFQSRRRGYVAGAVTTELHIWLSLKNLTSQVPPEMGKQKKQSLCRTCIHKYTVTFASGNTLSACDYYKRARIQSCAALTAACSPTWIACYWVTVEEKLQIQHRAFSATETPCNSAIAVVWTTTQTEKPCNYAAHATKTEWS